MRFNYLGIVPFFFGLFKINNYHGIQRKCILFTFISAILVIILSSLMAITTAIWCRYSRFLSVSTLLGGVALARAMGFYRYKIAVAIATIFLFIPARYPFQEYGLKLIAEKSQI